MIKLDNFENAILQSIENDEWQSKGNLDKRLRELKGYIKKQKKKAISIRLAENDLYELRKRALENSIPYQNLIQILVHQYTTNKINLHI